MTPELYQRLKPLYEAALELPKEKRAAYVAEACGNDSELRVELDKLLAEDETATGPLDKPFLSIKNLARKPAFSDGDLLLDRFRIVRFIDRGGMGEVYEAEDSFLRGVHVALKTILPDVASDPDLRKRFEREVLLAREVTHSHLCPIYDIFHCEEPPPGYLFLTMKLLRGQTLAKRLQLSPSMTTEEGLSLLRQASLGLAAIHAAGIIHRDIKPNNIMVDGQGMDLRLWITDFGLARAFEAESSVSPVGTIAGTPGYIAPELYAGHPPSQASDLFALGVVLHEVFAGQKPIPVPGTHSYTVGPGLTPPKVPALTVRLITEFLNDDPQRRCASFADALEVIDSRVDRKLYTVQKKQLWTRRRFAATAAAGICAVGGAAWWKRDDIEEIVEDIYEPLPDKRYVALLAWPTSDSAAVVSTILDSIGQRLARAESFVTNLLVVKGSDLPHDASVPATPADSASSLGANLVLAASLHPAPSTTTLSLHVLNATDQRMLRSANVEANSNELSSLGEKAAEAAARLLDLPAQETPVKDNDELHQLSPEAFKIFSEAEQLASQSKETALEGAIVRYQRVLDMEPRLSLAYARLSMAYMRLYLIDHESGRLKLAQSNATLALRYNPNSANALLSQAMVYLYSGRLTEALDFFARSAKTDPGNPDTLIYKAQALRNAGKWPEAEQVYRNICVERPNYWLAHNELGWILFQQAKYEQSADEFDIAATAAPQVALPLANLSSVYMYLGKREQAIDAAQRSLRRGQNEDAYITLGNIAFSDRNYRAALEHFRHAADLNPNSDITWGNIGDCYAMLGDPTEVQNNYRKAAQLLSSKLAANPHNGQEWATLAFYHAKIGDATNAQVDLKTAEAQGARDVQSQFMTTQALALLGRKEEALNLLLSCMDKGLSPVEVSLAVDLNEIRKDPRYISRVSKIPARAGKGA